MFPPVVGRDLALQTVERGGFLQYDVDGRSVNVIFGGGAVMDFDVFESVDGVGREEIDEVFVGHGGQLAVNEDGEAFGADEAETSGAAFADPGHVCEGVVYVGYGPVFHDFWQVDAETAVYEFDLRQLAPHDAHLNRVEERIVFRVAETVPRRFHQGGHGGSVGLRRHEVMGEELSRHAQAED